MGLRDCDNHRSALQSEMSLTREAGQPFSGAVQPAQNIARQERLTEAGTEERGLRRNPAIYFIVILFVSLGLAACGDDADTYITGGGEKSPLIANTLSTTEITLYWPDLAGGEQVDSFDIYIDGTFLEKCLIQPWEWDDNQVLF